MTNHDIQELGALSQDLKRVASLIGLGSPKSAERFLSEAIKGAGNISNAKMPPYVVNHIGEVSKLRQIEDPMELAETALTIGCILQNAAVAARR